MRLSRLFPLGLLLVGCATQVNQPAPGSSTPPAPSPVASPTPIPYVAPDPVLLPPGTRDGSWAPQLQQPAASTAPSLLRFQAPQGVVTQVGQPAKLQLADGCGPVTWALEDPSSAVVQPDGTLTPSRPGAIIAYAQQNGTRQGLQLAAVADPAPAWRFGPQAPATFVGPAEDEATLITDMSAWRTYWTGHVTGGDAPMIDFGKRCVLALSVTLYDDEAEPVVTDLQGGTAHVVLPEVPGGSAASGRGLTALFELPADPRPRAIQVLRRGRPAPGWPQPGTPPTPRPDPAAFCPPAWVWGGSPPPLSVQLARGASDVLTPGGQLELEAHSRAGETTWQATPNVSLGGMLALPLPWAPGANNPDYRAFGVQLTANAPGPVTVTAKAGAAYAYALLAVRAEREPALVFQTTRVPFTDKPALFTDDHAWAAFWGSITPPPVDFATRSAVLVPEDRVAYGPPGSAVVTHVDDAIHVVFTGLEAEGYQPRQIHTVHVFQIGRVLPGTPIRVVTPCDVR